MSAIKYIFGLIGLGMLVGAFFLFTNTQNFLKTATTSNGTVIDLQQSRSSDSITYAPVVEFQTKDGSRIEFISSTSSNPPSYSRGETVEVLYNESSPEKARINGFFSLWGGALIVGLIGLVFFLIGFLIILFGTLKSKNIKKLKESGTRISAEFQSVQQNTSLTVNGRHPFQILAQWQNPSTSKIHIFNSDNLWFDPTEHITSDQISVFVDLDNPKKYYVDTSFLPEIAS